MKFHNYLRTLALVIAVGYPAVAQTPAEDPTPPPPLRPRRVAPPTPPPAPPPTPTPDVNLGVGDDEVVRVSSNLVVVPVSVSDGQGNPVLGLKVGDFRLEEEGRAKEIASIGDPGQVPLDIALLIDVSGSVNARFDFEREAAARFLREVLRPGDQATVFTIGMKPELVQPLGTPEAAIARVRRIEPTRGPTAFYDTVMEALRELNAKSNSGRRRVLVVISDGLDNFSEKIQFGIGSTAEAQLASPLEVALRVNERERNFIQRELQRGEAVFYSINPSANTLHLDIAAARAENGMERLAQATGGNFFLPFNDQDLSTAFRQITSELRSQYLLQYYANEEAPAGQYLRINVATPAHPSYIIRARQGYYPKQQ